VEATDLSPDLENRLLARNVFSDGMLSNIRQAKNRLVLSVFRDILVSTDQNADPDPRIRTSD
jgi:hypothetical protein